MAAHCTKTTTSLIGLLVLCLPPLVGCGKSQPQEVIVHFKIDGMPSEGERRSNALASAAKSQASAFDTPLESYRLDVGHCPTTAEGLNALRVAPPGESKWNGPYLEREVPRDPWENQYQYANPGQKNGRSYDVWSFGPDGVNGTGDDIGNW